MYKHLVAMLVIATALNLTGCASETDILSASTKFNTSSNASSEKVTRTIITACAAQGWKPSIAGPGRIIAARHSSGHAAKVEISYTTDTFTIQYLDSDNMGYDGKHISETYGDWVDGLRNEIKTRLSAL